MASFKKLNRCKKLIDSLHQEHKSSLETLMLGLGTPQTLMGLLHTLKTRAEERENGPEGKFKAFEGNLTPTEKTKMTPQERAALRAVQRAELELAEMYKNLNEARRHKPF